MKIWIVSTLLLIANPFSLAISNSSAGFGPLMPQPKSLWTLNVSPAKYGNECKVFSNDELLICSGMDGATVAVTSRDGKKLWVHNPLPTTLTNVRSSSGISFGYTPTIGHYVAHAVSEGYDFADPSYCVVYALSVETGEEVWASKTLKGSCSGSPVVSKSGEYVFMNHNLLGSGSFTVLEAEANGATLFSYEDKIQPFGPLGIHHHPNEGYYLGGQMNDNDILVWAYRPSINSTTVGVGMTFAFQFPMGFTSDSTTLAVKPLGTVTWQAIVAPSIFNNGYSMMWGVSRSEYRVWNGNFGLAASRFDKASTGSAEFPRGDPKSQPVYTALELSSSPTEPMAFGGTSSNQFVAFDSFLKEMWRINTTFPVFAEARISPDDAVVYFVEQNGRAYAVDVSSGKIMWSSLLGGTPVTANFAQSKSGKYLYIINQAGILQAWKVADATSPVPSFSPSGPLVETSNPSQVPTSQSVSPMAKLTPTVIPFVANKSLAPSPVPTSKGSPTKGNPTKLSPAPTIDPTTSPKPPVSAITGPTSDAASYQTLALRIALVTFAFVLV